MVKARWLVIWTERIGDSDYDAGNYGPRFHPRFGNAKVTKNDGRRITLVKDAYTLDMAKDLIHHIASWGEGFESHIERNLAVK